MSIKKTWCLTEDGKVFAKIMKGAIELDRYQVAWISPEIADPKTPEALSKACEMLLKPC